MIFLGIDVGLKNGRVHFKRFLNENVCIINFFLINSFFGGWGVGGVILMIYRFQRGHYVVRKNYGGLPTKKI